MDFLETLRVEQQNAIADTLRCWSEGTYPFFTVGERAGKSMFLIALAHKIRTLQQYSWVKDIYVVSPTVSMAEYLAKDADDILGRTKTGGRYIYPTSLQSLTDRIKQYKDSLLHKGGLSPNSVTAKFMQGNVYLFDNVYAYNTKSLGVPEEVFNTFSKHICVVGKRFQSGADLPLKNSCQRRFAAWDWNPDIMYGSNVLEDFKVDFQDSALRYGLWDSNNLEIKLAIIHAAAPQEIKDLYPKPFRT